MFEEFKPLLKKSILECLKETNKANLFFSSGLDSSSIFFLLKELESDFSCYTYCLEGHKSKDIEYSSKICDHYNIEQKIISVPKLTKDETIEKIVELMKIIKSFRKTHVESIYSFLFLDKKELTENLFFGLECISGTSKKTSIKVYKDDTPDRFKEIVMSNFSNDSVDGRGQLKLFFDTAERKTSYPFHNLDILNYITFFTHKQLHHPKQKMYIYESFKKEFNDLSSYRRSANGHLEAGVRDHLMKVFECSLPYQATKKYKELYRERVENV